jgi:FkbM family methyltransferase
MTPTPASSSETAPDAAVNVSPRPYTRNKVRTLFQLVKSIRNWPDAVELRLWRDRARLRLLEFRDGLNVVLRGGTNEWSVVHELLFAGGYEKALDWLSFRREPEPYVMDLGGNIGLFALLAARTKPNARIVSFEPGPPNFRIYRMNMLANPTLARQIELREIAVGGTAGEAVWNFHEDNPGGSSLHTGGGEMPSSAIKVQLGAFADYVAEAPGEIALVKMDIEGAEWDILAKTPDAAWSKIQAIALELHDDPSGQRAQSDFIAGMKRLGFQVEAEAVCTYFLHR